MVDMDWYDPQYLFIATRDWLMANPHWAGVVMFALAAAESLAGVGILVPGITAFFAIGSLIGVDVLNFWSMLICAIAGAIVGDNLSFWLGKHYRDRLWRVWPLSRYPELPVQGQQFFAKHGGKSVIFGRFVGPIRAIVPAVAGMSNMSSTRFFAVNVFSAILWAPLVLIPGMLFGEAIADAKAYLFEMLLFVLVFFGLLNLWMWGCKRWYQPEQLLLSLTKIGVSLALLLALSAGVATWWWQWRMAVL